MNAMIATDEFDPLETILAKLEAIQATLEQLSQPRVTKEYYSTADVAKLLNKAEFTVREWCRNHRVYAEKRACGRGPMQDWIISHKELERIRNHGLLPPRW